MSSDVDAPFRSAYWMWVSLAVFLLLSIGERIEALIAFAMFLIVAFFSYKKLRRISTSLSDARIRFIVFGVLLLGGIVFVTSILTVWFGVSKFVPLVFFMIYVLAGFMIIPFLPRRT